MIKITLIVVNYFTLKNIDFLLESLEFLKKKDNFEVIIVNNSPVEKIDFPFKNSFNVKVVDLQNNPGFGFACNAGVSIAGGEYLAFVNPDIIFKINPFDMLISFLNNNSKAGVIGVTLLNPDESRQYSYNNFPNFKWELHELIGNSTLYINKKMNTISSKPFPVDWVIGAFMFMKKNVFMEVGGFDEDFFLYYEDTDLQKRINNAGYKNYLVPDAKVMHGTKSSIKGEEGNKAYNVYMNKSKMLYFYKHSNFLVRNFVRVINLIRILSRLVLFPLKALMQKSSLSDLKILINNFTVYLHTKAYYYN